MAMNGYVDDMMCEGLFDNIEDLLDFSTDDEVLGMGDSSSPSASTGGGGGGGGDGGAIQMPSAVVSTVTASFPSADGEGCRVLATDDEAKICDEINIHEDWITSFLDDSNFDIDFPAATGIIAAAAPPCSDYVGNGSVGKDGDDSQFQSFSPVSVLDEPNNLSSGIDTVGSSSSSSSSSSSTSSSRNNGTTAGAISLAMAPVGPTMMLVPARARSKRPRRAAPVPTHVAVPIVPPASEGPPAVPTLLPECESFGESEPCALKRKKKKSHHQNFLAGTGNACSGDDATAARRCQHCGIQKTPQWRAGPMGPKTLCNACGVRYKSGRLFPEYRPAASPTFVPSIHSNSHKRVVEMRIKACQQKAANGMPTPEYPAAKNCDLLAYIRRGE